MENGEYGITFFHFRQQLTLFQVTQNDRIAAIFQSSGHSGPAAQRDLTFTGVTAAKDVDFQRCDKAFNDPGGIGIDKTGFPPQIKAVLFSDSPADETDQLHIVSFRTIAMIDNKVCMSGTDLKIPQSEAPQTGLIDQFSGRLQGGDITECTSG